MSPTTHFRLRWNIYALKIIPERYHHAQTLHLWVSVSVRIELTGAQSDMLVNRYPQHCCKAYLSSGFTKPWQKGSVTDQEEKQNDTMNEKWIKPPAALKDCNPLIEAELISCMHRKYKVPVPPPWELHCRFLCSSTTDIIVWLYVRTSFKFRCCNPLFYLVLMCRAAI